MTKVVCGAPKGKEPTDVHPDQKGVLFSKKIEGALAKKKVRSHGKGGEADAKKSAGLQETWPGGQDKEKGKESIDER